jgi:hypothetical protein
MPRTALRVAAGLTLAAGLASASTPALGDPSSDETGVVRAAAVSEPTPVSFVDEAAVPSPQPILQELSDRIAADVAAAEEAAALQRLAAAEEAAQLERFAAAVAAEEARRAEQERLDAQRSAPAGSVEEIIHRWFGASGATAVQVARCESGLNPAAVSPGGGNHGLFQINDVHRGTFESVTGQPWSAVYSAEANTRFAHWLWSQQGWGPWACA